MSGGSDESGGGKRGGKGTGGDGAGHGMAATMEHHQVKTASALPTAECDRGKANAPGAPSGTGIADKGSKSNFPPSESK